ncbi:MAG TPA: 4'-phosphopantetheinyl transferase superfamily protein [Acidimicrobiales bacterium]
MTVSSVDLRTRPWDCRVATDLVRVGEVAAAVDRYGERYLRRVYTDHELQTCATVPGETADAGPNVGLAARFAAKAATLKVLARSGVRPELRAVEVLHHPEGAFVVSLTGDAAAAAAAMGIGRISVSLSHAGGTASAVAVALCDEPRTEGLPDAAGAPVGPAVPRNEPDPVRAVIDDHAGLVVAADDLGEHDDLVAAGLTAHGSVSLLLGLEERFGLRLPASMSQPAILRTVAAIRVAVHAAR